MEAYLNWIETNGDTAHRLESMLRSAVMMIPGRFGKSEVILETVLGCLDFISFSNDLIIYNKFFRAEDPGANKQHERIEGLSLLLSITKKLQKMMEIITNYRILSCKKGSIGRKKATKTKWKIILVIEIVKAIIRTLLLLGTKGCTLSSENVIEKMASIGRGMREDEDNYNFDMSHMTHEDEDMMIPTLNGDFRRRNRLGVKSLMNRVKEEEKVVITDIEPELDSQCFIGEILHIFSPVIYASSYLLFDCNERNWVPWYLQLSLQIISYGLKAKGQDHDGEAAAAVRRRVLSWALILLRPPFFGLFLRKKLIFVLKVLKNIPIFGAVFDNALDLLKKWDLYFFYFPE